MTGRTKERRGRGSGYSIWRYLVEESLLRLYGGGWPGRLWWRLVSDGPRVVEHRVAVLGWPPNLPPLRMAFASDLHAGPTTDRRLWQAACDALAAAKPDVLLLGGDYIFLRASFVDPLAQALGRIPAPLGRYAVMGNHDLWADEQHIERRLVGSGIEVLVNRCVRLPAPHDHVWICGLDEPWKGVPDAGATFAGAEGVRVLLMHAPSGLLFVEDHRFDVALCGHTHGGHIALPGGIPVVAPGPLSRRYSHGRHRIERDHHGPLLVSRGVGGVEVPMRLFAEPDILVCTLGPA